MTSFGGMLCQLAVFARRKWRKVLFRNIDQFTLSCLCCWMRCWILQVIDTMEASYVLYVKVGMITRLEQSKIFLLTINQMGIVRLTVQHDLIVSVSCTCYAIDYLRQTSADVCSLESCSIYSWQSCHFGCHTMQFVPVNKQAASDWLIAHLRVVGNPCNLQRYVAGFMLSIMITMAATDSILTWH